MRKINLSILGLALLLMLICLLAVPVMAEDIDAQEIDAPAAAAAVIDAPEVDAATPDEAVMEEAVYAAEAPDHCEAPLKFMNMYAEDEDSAAALTTDAVTVSAKSTDSEAKILLAVTKAVRTALLNGTTTIDISGLKLDKDGFFRHIGYYCIYADGNNIEIDSWYSGSTGIFTKLEITNYLSAADTKTWVNQIDKAVQNLCELVDDTSISQEDRALILHDYMASNYYYDTTYSDYYPSIMLLTGSGVCQSYAYLYQYIMDLNGIECHSAVSSNHAWNIIKLGGKYYHIDVTWDDPTSDYWGQAQHDYFLLTDSEICDSSSHSSWDLRSTYPCTTKKTLWYRDVGSPMVYWNGSWYYCTFNSGDSNGYLMRRTGTTSTKLINLGKWTVYGDSSSYWLNCYTGLFEHGGLLYTNSASLLYAYDLTTGSTTSYSVSATSNGSIYGIIEDGDLLVMAIQTKPSVDIYSKNLYKTDLPEASMGWTKLDGKWYYYKFSGAKATGWQKISNKWYYFGSSGVMKTGWQKISGKWYHFDSSGAMQTGWQQISKKWYYFDSNGVMKTGWQQISKKWYYFDSDGIMQTGWQKISNKWYHFDSSGAMQTGWQKISSKWYHFDSSGAMQTGWQKISGKWYWFDSSGVMAASKTVTINGKAYKFNSDGVCTNP